MKKAKIMLSTIAIAALSATALGFKIEDFTKHFIYTGKLKSGVCTVRLNGAGIMGGGVPNAAASISATTSHCPDVYTVEIND